MKLILHYGILSLLVALLFSCQKENDVQEDENGGNKPGLVVPPGTPDGSAPAKKTIGQQGGTLKSTDGRIEIDIPQGALTGNQEISIQRISNTNPMKLNQAYRIEPHGITFKKEVKLSFYYTEEDLAGTVAEALEIAYQNDKGIWIRVGGPELDKENKTVTVSTTHFSDWSFFESFKITPDNTTVEPGGSVELYIFSDADDILAPLEKGKEQEIGEPGAMTAKFIKKWTLAGAGSLETNGARAVYKAPSAVPSKNPVAVSVEVDLNKKGKFLVVANITITGSYIEFSIGGGIPKKIPATPVVRMGGLYLLSNPDNEGGGYFLLRWPGGKGSYGYSIENNGGHFHWEEVGGYTYMSKYIEEDRLLASGGSVNIESMGEDDGYVKGSFSVTPTGYGPTLRRSLAVEGSFKVRKGF